MTIAIVAREATIYFPARKQAEAFARAWTRKTLRGHSIIGTEVHVYDVTEDDRMWIDATVEKMSHEMEI